MDTVAVIPARDEEATIAAVVRELRDAVPAIRVVVVDDGSVDRTADLARGAGATVVTPRRHGYGHAARAGSDAARGAGAVVYLDADGSMPAAEVPRLLAPIERGEADVVLGRRRLSRAAMPWHQRLGNRVIAALLRLNGVRASELGPFRAVRGSTLEALPLGGSRFAWHAEMLVLARRAGARIVEIPAEYRPRAGGRSKVGGSLRGSLRATWDIGRALARPRGAR